MSDREKLPELIDRYNSGNLSADELDIFLEMLKTNPRLREEVALDKELNEILAKEDILELRQKILAIRENQNKRKGTDLHFLLLAASLLLLIAIEALLFINKGSQNPSKNTTLPPGQKQNYGLGQDITHADREALRLDSVNKKEKVTVRRNETILAANFRLNPSLEKMVGAMRNSGFFKMVAPLTGTRFREKEVIRFEWTKEKEIAIDLKILDNTGKIIHESGSLIKNKYSIPAGEITSGLYYFRVLQNDEIVFSGKFFVE